MYCGRGLLAFLAVLAVAAAAKIIKPANYYFDLCHTSDPKFNECVQKSLKSLIPTLVKGIPELQLAPIEPMNIPKIEMGDGSGNFKLHMVLSNLTIRGASNYMIKESDINTKTMDMKFRHLFPNMHFEGDYVIDGQILVLPVKGNGRATFDFEDVDITSVIKMEEFEKNNKKYLRVKNYKLSINPKHASSIFTNLFNGDKQLGDATNKFLNDNWKEAFTAYKELPERAFSQYFKYLSNRVFMAFPKDELFPK